jgi:hypothetical protein
VKNSRACLVLELLAPLLLLLTGLTHSPEVEAQSRCSSTDDSTKHFCTGREIHPWQWFWRFGSNATHGPFPTQAAALAHLESWVPDHYGASWCTMTLDHMSMDTTPATSYSVPREYVYVAHYYVTEFKGDANPCQQDAIETFVLTQRRTFDCPESLQSGQDWTLYVDATLGPYCAIPWNEVFDREPKLCKGNPCDVLNNAKYQFELDYAGAGPFPLRFQRTYDSRTAFKTYQGSLDQEFFTPLGIGWTATYFQSIWYVQEQQRSEPSCIARTGGGSTTTKPVA